MTLVELMVAIFVLGILLSATAASLITFSRQAATNERRVQATALLNELHEEMQTLPWDLVGLYEDEISGLDAIGVDLTLDPPEFEGNELVVLEAPDDTTCDVVSPGCARHPLVPRAEQQLTIDDREYTVRRAITGVDRTGNGEADVKRFTTIVEWSLLGRTLQQRYDSERAPTMAEIDVPVAPEVVQFSVTPDSVPLAADGSTAFDLSVVARFNRGITAAEINYTALDAAGDPVDRTLTLTPTLWEMARPIAFAGTIPAGSQRFDITAEAFELTGYDGLDTVTAVTSVDFLPPSAGTPPTVAVEPPSKSTVNVGKSGTHTGKLQCSLTITARATGLDVGSTVTLNYTSITAQGITMTPPAIITGSNDVFTWTFPKDSQSVWPTATSEQFIVVARNSAGLSSAAVTSSTVQINRSNGNC